MAGDVKVLYVDDEDDIRAIVEMSLGLDPALIVRSASGGMEGIDIARSWRPNLIMLDYMMPGLDGPRTLAQLKTHAATMAIPVIFVTARTQTHQVTEMINMGAVGVISKPFDPITLARDVRQYIDRFVK